MPRFTGSTVDITVETPNKTLYLEITECSTESDIGEAITEQLKEYECTEDDLNPENWSINCDYEDDITIAQLAIITDHDSDVVEAAFDLGVTTNNAIGLLERNDYYQHNVTSYRDYVEELMQDLGQEIPNLLYGHINWESAYDDLTYDLSIGTAKNGCEYVFTS